MKPVNLRLRLQPAPANLLRTAVCGANESIYISVPESNGSATGLGDCVWTDSTLSVFAKAHQTPDGLVIDLCVAFGPPARPAVAVPAA